MAKTVLMMVTLLEKECSLYERLKSEYRLSQMLTTNHIL